jgi:hypothetical protein
MSKKPPVPIGIAHLSGLVRASAYVANETAKHLDEVENVRDTIGTGLSVLYQAATCHRECHGGAHVLERLCGRAYNLGCAAHQLVVIGLYDEALNLVRGMGEMSNLVILSAVDRPKIQEWVHANRKERMKNFSPFKVRRMIEATGFAACATDEWYRELSEDYTHVSPETLPNFHGGAPWVGGKFETEGMRKSFGALCYVLIFVGLFICKHFKFDDLFAELSSKLREPS